MSELPKGWTETSLGSLVELKYGKSLPKGDRTPGPYKVYGSNGIVGTNNSSITSEPAIIVGRKGSFGEVHFSPQSCFPIDTTYYIDSFDTVDPFFCFYLLRHLPLKTLNRATAIPGLNREDAYNLSVALPPSAEQKRIVAKLDALNAKSARARTELVRIETLASRYKQAVLSKAFGGELSKPDLSGWRTTTLGDLALDVRYGTAKKSTYAPELTPVLRIPNVADGRIDLGDMKHAAFTDQEVKKLALVEGDLLVIRSNGSVDLVGRAAVVDSTAVGMLFAGYLIRIRLDQERVCPQYIQFWLQSSEARSHIEGAAKSTSGVNNLNSQQLQSLQLRLPPLDEQMRIVHRIEGMFAGLAELTAEAGRAVALLKKLGEAVLARAFSGRLVPQDEKDEPASALLETFKHARFLQAPEVRVKASATPRKVRTMADTIFETLSQAKDWLSSQELFERCGVRDGSSTEDVEKLYRQLLELERQSRIEIEEIADPSTGTKQGDRVRLRR